MGGWLRRESCGTYGEKFKRNATNYGKIMAQGYTTTNNQQQTINNENNNNKLQLAIRGWKRKKKMAIGVCCHCNSIQCCVSAAVVVVVADFHFHGARDYQITSIVRLFAEFMINVSNISTICNHKWKFVLQHAHAEFVATTMANNNVHLRTYICMHVNICCCRDSCLSPPQIATATATD